MLISTGRQKQSSKGIWIELFGKLLQNSRESIWDKVNFLVNLEAYNFQIYFKKTSLAHNQELFRAGEVSSNLGTSINIHLQHEKERPRRQKIYGFFTQKVLKIYFKWYIYTYMTKIRTFFLQIRVLFPNSWKRAGETYPSPV